LASQTRAALWELEKSRQKPGACENRRYREELFPTSHCEWPTTFYGNRSRYVATRSICGFSHRRSHSIRPGFLDIPPCMPTVTSIAIFFTFLNSASAKSPSKEHTRPRASYGPVCCHRTVPGYLAGIAAPVSFWFQLIQCVPKRVCPAGVENWCQLRTVPLSDPVNRQLVRGYEYTPM
jgi:hypothetical protein